MWSNQRPTSTRRAYASDWRSWEGYTRDVGIPLYAATTGALVGFVRWMDTGKQAAPATIDRRPTRALAATTGSRARRPAERPGTHCTAIGAAWPRPASTAAAGKPPTT